MSKRDWTELSATAFAPIIGSGNTRELLRNDWPAWAQNAPQVQRLWIYGLATNETIPSLQTTAKVVARLVTERFDAGDREPNNYNWYAVVKITDDRYLQSGPHNNIDFGHHLAQPVSDTSLGIWR
jgi:hypothetical protein